MKNILITGGTNGIGLSALKTLAKEDYYPILICRSETKAKDTIRTLGKGRYYCCDLGNLDEVQLVCQHILANEQQIDFFIGNAGVIGFDKETKTKEGVEKTIQINFLSHYVICETLKPVFNRAQTRIIFTSSVMHKSRWHANYDFSIGLNIAPYSPFKTYARSKACVVTYADYFAKNNPNNAVFLADPGVVGTGIMRSRGKWMNVLFAIAKPFFSSEEKGARPLVCCVKASPNENKRTTYTKGQKSICFHPKAQDITVQKELIRQAEKVINKLYVNLF